MSNFWSTFAKHALLAAIFVGTFATLIETSKLKPRTSAFIYATLPVGFLYLVAITWTTHGRTACRNFSKTTLIGMVPFLSLILSFYLVDLCNGHPCIQWIVSILLWIILTVVLYFTVVKQKKK